MNPRAGAALFVACVVVTALFFLLRPNEPTPSEPLAAPAPKKRVIYPREDLPKVAPRVYSFPRVDPAPPPAAPEPQRPLNHETHKLLATATNGAMKGGYQQCVKPWLEEDVVPEDAPTEPLVVFFDMVDGRLSDVRLRSPVEIPKNVVDCFAEAVWEEPFPEDPEHRGTVSVQRVIPIRK